MQPTQTQPTQTQSSRIPSIAPTKRIKRHHTWRIHSHVINLDLTSYPNSLMNGSQWQPYYSDDLDQAEGHQLIAVVYIYLDIDDLVHTFNPPANKMPLQLKYFQIVALFLKRAKTAQIWPRWQVAFLQKRKNRLLPYYPLFLSRYSWKLRRKSRLYETPKCA